MSIESLKQQARRHEQNEEWQKALDQYLKAIDALARDDQTDIGLINRVGDLYVRVGKLNSAVEHYENAVDLYREAFLPNNAIAVCKKIIRNVPERHQAYLKIGQIRAEQGFLPDARTNFLTYAERMQQAGDLDESFRALVEFCDLAPDDVDVRVTVADQMVANDRSAEAVEQLTIAYQHLTQSGESDLADSLEKKILELDPQADLTAVAAMDVGMGGEESDFGDIELSGYADDAPDFGASSSSFGAEAPSADLVRAAEEIVEQARTGFDLQADEEEDEDDAPMDFELSGGEDDEEEVEDEAVELPMMGFGDDDEADEDEGEPLPTMGFDLPSGRDDAEEEEAVELPMMGFGDEDDDDEEDEGEAVELPMMSFDDEEDGQAVEEPEDAISEASSSLAEAMEEAAPSSEPEKVLVDEPAAPPAPKGRAPSGGGDSYVDLGAMILGGNEKTTRFKVAYEEPSGDEDADFAKMLSQFKEKVSENLDSGDVRAHHDLGTAYKEMGLLEEAISSFQSALRADPAHLPTYEMMGQAFIEMDRADAAVRTLERALQVKTGVEDEFVGIYYYLARAYEALENRDSAIEYYDRVFSLDINFADVTERLRALR